MGSQAFDAAYASGRSLAKDAAPKRLDPATLEEDPRAAGVSKVVPSDTLGSVAAPGS